MTTTIPPTTFTGEYSDINVVVDTRLNALRALLHHD